MNAPKDLDPSPRNGDLYVDVITGKGSSKVHTSHGNVHGARVAQREAVARARTKAFQQPRGYLAWGVGSDNWFST